MQDLKLETMELALGGEIGDAQLALNPKDPHPVPEISTESQNLQQVYERTMCVNIAMTHVIHEYKRLELRARENKPDTGITIGVQGPPQVNAETG
jgi:hypothetical protein